MTSNLLGPGPATIPPMNRSTRPTAGLAVAAADAVAWIAALVLAVLLRYELDVGEIDLTGLLWTALGAATAQVMTGSARRAYSKDRPAHSDDAASLTASVFVVGLVVFGVTLLGDPPLVPRSTPLVAIPIAVLILIGLRGALRARMDRPDPADPRRTRRALVVGSGDDAEYLVRSMLRDPDWGILPVALLDEGRARRRRIPGVGTGRTGAGLSSVADRFDADMLIIATSTPDEDSVATLTDSAGEAGLPVLVVPPIADLIRSLSPINPPEGPGPTRVPRHTGRRGARARAAVKRTLDITLCLAAMPLVLPVLLIVTTVLVLSRGDVFYPAPRVGRHGRTFTMFKFATMRPGDSGPRVTRENDPRITPVGRILRTTKLNELPQILNVLRGDMSIVGPRPEDLRYARSYTPAQRAVWEVRPGMTSLSYLEFGDEQVYIERARPDDLESYYVTELLPAKLAIELEYVEGWSVAGDIAVITRTLARLVSAKSPTVSRTASPAPPATSRSAARAAASRRRR